MKRYQQFIFTLIFISTIFSSFHIHIHDEAEKGEHCQICIFQDNLASGDIPKTFYLNNVDQYSETTLYSILLFSYREEKTFNSRAPPSFS